MWTYLKGKLGLCQCNKCLNKSTYTFKVDGVIRREVCEKHRKEINKLLEK